MFAACTTISNTGESQVKGGDPFADYVWPPPPDTPRIKLHQILRGRADVEAKTRWQKVILGTSPREAFDFLRKPFAAEYDRQGRILVTDPGLSALIRFDRRGHRMDVFGTTGALVLKTPLGLAVGPDETIYVADASLAKIIAFSPDGKLLAAYGKEGELINPTDVALTPDNAKILVTDSKAHQLVIFDRAQGRLLERWGTRGVGEGEFNFPTALTIDKEGHVFVVDQINARIQIFDKDGAFLESLGGRGVGFGNFVRPKDISVDTDGLIYVTDAAFNNVQIFSPDLRLLTFVGQGGQQPGAFRIASGVACWQDEFAVVDQLNARVQVFRYIAGKTLSTSEEKRN